MTQETQIKKTIKDYLKIKGAFVYHNLAGLGVYPGIPDLTCIYQGQVYQIEVKTPKGKQNNNQKKFQKEWGDRGGLYIVGGIDEVMKLIY